VLEMMGGKALLLGTGLLLTACDACKEQQERMRDGSTGGLL
jgi:hypothetical protein